MNLLPYVPTNHYWTNGVNVFSSKTQTRVSFNDNTYQAWLALGNVPTIDPGDAQLREVLRPYEIGVTPEETADFVQARADVAALKAAYNEIIADLNTVAGLTTPLTNAQRDASIKGLAAHLKTILKGLKLIYGRMT